MVQRKRSQKRRSLRKRSQRKRSQRKRSQRKRSQRNQTGGGWFSWYKSVSKDDCERVAQKLLDDKAYTNPTDFVFDYNLKIANDSGILGKSGHKLKAFFAIAGFTTAYSLNSGMLVTMLQHQGTIKTDNRGSFEGMNSAAVNQDILVYYKEAIKKIKTERKAQAALALTFIATLASIAYKERKKKRNQSKMILEVCANSWNNEYPNQKISTNDIKKMVMKNKHSKEYYKSIMRQSPEDIRHVQEHEKFLGRQAPSSGGKITINLNYSPGEAQKLPGGPKLTM